MKLLGPALALLVCAVAANAQTPISSFPYFFDWKNPAPFTTSDGTTYAGGDGHWGTYNVGTIPQFTTNNSGWVETNHRGNINTLFLSVDARGRSFSGAEVFAFDALRAGSTTGTLHVYANSTVILTLQIESDLTTGTWRHFSAPLPPELGNSVFTLYIKTNSNKDVAIDNTGISGGSLPITLSSFKINLEGASPVLSWTTLSEINNYGFYVEKSQDMTTWTEVANSFQHGYGTTTEAHSYRFADYSLPTGTYYRLHYLDLDGTHHYSEAVSVVSSVDPVTVAQGFSLSQNYPNPFNPKTGVRFEVIGVSDVKLVVYDMLGREVSVLVNERKGPGRYEVTFDASGLASGIYVYQLTAGNSVETKKMVLQK